MLLIVNSWHFIISYKSISIMSLRQFIAARKKLRSFDIFDFVKDSFIMGWKEVASLFGLHDDVFEDPRPIKIEKR